ncbi:isopenicillin N synthase family dioxygenase [Litoreibacter roseus]|uniref:2-oxoglutarate-dependent ethylene/succinate-forming enzyme n=1 Tax=Litoreibacter roseus TaxID=2601869 RepID=A0A6N6JIE5_9RHOB|nr:2-oxoglutarate and iron-dependent oxygenase domain-containing protein [Litoreibacter roseus]GFE65179.1 2OG-Fe(II) oxygenase [Litoreibacter roseus]
MIPVLDWQRFEADSVGFAAELGAACRGSGFFLLQNHPVTPALIDATFDTADTFFALDPAEKSALSIGLNDHNRGWVGQGHEKLAGAHSPADQKEAFNIGLDLAPDDARVLAGEPFRGVNVWPDLDGFKDTTLAYFDACLDLSTALMQAVALDLQLLRAHFAPHFTAPLATLRLLHYPASQNGAGIGAGAHTDYGALTLLMTDGEAGLQVQPRGQDWTDVPHVPGAFIVNIGDCLMRWTNDIYISTPHRVLPPRNQRRSIAFFLDPNPDTLVETLPGTGTPRYAPITGADYLRMRLDATYEPAQ